MRIVRVGAICASSRGIVSRMASQRVASHPSKARKLREDIRSSSLTASAAAAPWWVGETAVRVTDLPRHLPPRPDGQRVSITSAFRYTLNGVSGIRLRRFRATAGTWATTLEELARWQAAITNAAEAGALA